MAQDLGRQILLAAIGVDQGAACFRLGHRIDRQVAPGQILFQRHIAGCMESKAVIARRELALGPRQRIFFMAERMQEDRKVTPDRQIALGQQCVRVGADDDPVAILHHQTEQRIAHRTADQISLHQMFRSAGALR